MDLVELIGTLIACWVFDQAIELFDLALTLDIQGARPGPEF